jgi:hypothetical protein
MKHRIWKPSSKKRSEAEMICGLVVQDIDHQIPFGATIQVGIDGRLCAGCYGPLSDGWGHGILRRKL